MPCTGKLEHDNGRGEQLCSSLVSLSILQKADTPSTNYSLARLRAREVKLHLNPRQPLAVCFAFAADQIKVGFLQSLSN